MKFVFFISKDLVQYQVYSEILLIQYQVYSEILHKWFSWNHCTQESNYHCIHTDELGLTEPTSIGSHSTCKQLQIYKIMVNKVSFVGYRVGWSTQLPPPASDPALDSVKELSERGSNFLNYVQHIFPWGRKPPCSPIATDLSAKPKEVANLHCEVSNSQA